MKERFLGSILRARKLITKRISNIDLLVYSQIATHPLVQRNSLDRERFAIYKGLVRCYSIVAGRMDVELLFQKGMA